MERIELEVQEMYLMWFLVKEFEKDEQRYHDARVIIRSKFEKIETKKIEGWVGHLGLQGFVEVLDEKKPFEVRIAKDGMKFYQESLPHFENFKFESPQKGFAELKTLSAGAMASKDIQDETPPDQGTDNFIVELSDDILRFLLEWKTTKDPNLKFWLRSKDNNHRLSEGQWFLGNSTYIFIGFTKRGDAKNKTKTIGFVIKLKNSEISEIYFELAYPDEDDKNILACYNAIMNTFHRNPQKGSKKHFHYYSINSWRRSLETFLINDLPKIENWIEEYELTNEFDISDEQFDQMLSSTLKMRESKGYSPLPEFQSKRNFIPPEYDHGSELVPDVIAEKDELGRKVLMETLHKKITTLWDKIEESESFTMLINGEWGSGKSSMLHYLEEFLKESGWSVVKYNAWRNQRFEDPWWILVNKVSKEVTKTKWYNFRKSHFFWKIKHQNSTSYTGAVIAAVVFVGLFSWGIIESNEDLKFWAGILALAGGLPVFINGVIRSVFKKRAFEELQARQANDPLGHYKDRFHEVVEQKQVAIFIDDLDRCDVEATVKLLEGIQTLFKESKVLYVIAADGQWVSNCFDKKYEQFDSLVSAGQTIGNQFLQKTFQLIVDVPKLSRDHQSLLLDKYLSREKEETERWETESEEKIKAEIEDAETLEELGGVSLGSNSLGSTTTKATERAEKIIEKNKEHYMHKLLEQDGMPQNPRQMIRLLNLFTIKVQELIISQVLNDVGTDVVLKYIHFANSYPAYNQAIKYMDEEKWSKEYPGLKQKLGDMDVEIIKEYL